MIMQGRCVPDTGLIADFPGDWCETLWRTIIPSELKATSITFFDIDGPPRSEGVGADGSATNVGEPNQGIVAVLYVVLRQVVQEFGITGVFDGGEPIPIQIGFKYDFWSASLRRMADCLLPSSSIF